VLVDMYVEWAKQGHTGDTEEEEQKAGNFNRRIMLLA